MNLGEDNAGKSIFGTAQDQPNTSFSSTHHHSFKAIVKGIIVRRKEKAMIDDLLIYPSKGERASGSETSAFIPQTIVVSPILTKADPSAVPIDPNDCKCLIT